MRRRPAGRFTLRRTCLYILFASLVSSFSLPSSDAAPLYTIKDITPDGYTSSTAYDINKSGDAVGVATRFVSGSPVEAYFFYDHSAGTSTAFGEGTVSPRGSIVGTGFREAAINDDGLIAGTARFLSGATEWRGFIYSSGTFNSLGTFFQGAGTGSNIRPRSDALDINKSGVATGTASSGAATSDNLDIYAATAAPIGDIDGDITALTKGDYGRAINDAGLIAGSNEASRAAVFSGAAETVFLTGTSLGGVSSVATDLNDSAHVTGHTSDADSFVYDLDDSELTIVPQIGTGNRMFAKAINEDGDVVGWGDRDEGISGQGRGFVYEDGTSFILEDHVVLTGSDREGLSDWGNLKTAWGINDDGMIVGVGDRRFDGATFPNPRAYLLLPVEDGTILGDYNGNGVVDPADYSAWLAALGASDETLINNSGDGGGVTLSDYHLWRTRLGNTSGSGSFVGTVGLSTGGQIPEPNSLFLILIGLACANAGLDRSQTDF